MRMVIENLALKDQIGQLHQTKVSRNSRRKMQIVLLKTKKKLLNFMPIGSFKAGIHEPKPVLVLGLDNDPRDQGQQNVQNLVPVVAVYGTLIQGISFTLTIATLYFVYVLFELKSKEKEAQAKNITQEKNESDKRYVPFVTDLHLLLTHVQKYFIGVLNKISRVWRLLVWQN